MSLKVFISVDIEGATGVASFSQCSRPDSQFFDYPFARRALIGDVNAAIRGAKRAGAERVVVKDSHATCKNLLIDELEPGTELISGFGATRDGMMDGIDDSFAAAMLVGYHGQAGRTCAMMDHALVGGLYRFWVNDTECGEIAVSAAAAGACGVPTILVTGDHATCAETSETITGAFTYCTKQGLGKYMGNLLHPSETIPGIEAAAESAVRARAGISPFKVEGAVEMRAEFRTTEETDLVATMEGVRRLNGYTVGWSRPDFVTAHRAMLAIFNMSIQGRRSES